MPDAITARAPDAEASEDETIARSLLELRAEVDSKEDLLRQKRAIFAELLPLRAMYRSQGNSSPADSARKRHRALIAKKILRKLKDEAGEKYKEPSETALERMANATKAHRAFCDRLQANAERYEILEGQLEEIDYRLRARETELHVYGKELGLAR